MKKAKDFWNGKVVLITGGSSGIGLAVARLLATRRARLWLMARDWQKLEAAQGELTALGAKFCGILPADVTDPAGVAQAIKTVEQGTGAPDVLITSAGIVEPGYFQELSLDTFRKTMEVNFIGSVCVVKACLPGMAARKSGQVVLISSAAGYLGITGYTAYSPSKYALRGFAEALRMEMRYDGIRVSIVYPPDTDTPQLAYDRSFKIPEIDIIRQLDGMASAQEVAKAIVRGIERKRFIIAPLASNRFFYHLIRWLDTGSFFIVDWLSDLGRKRAGKPS